MIELGHYSLVFAWAMSLFAIAALWFSRRHRTILRQSAYRAVVAAFILIATASLALLVLLVRHDFRVEYVAAYTSRDLPLTYVLTAFWGGQAGSLLLWALLLAVFSVIVLGQNRNKHEDSLPYVSAVIVGVQHFFLSVILFAANPFETLQQVPVDGRGLNPLLQNFFMIIHPPFLYLGYVAFTVPFAFAIASLALKKRDAEWTTLSRRWTLVSWCFLTAGILLGAYWAYIELGWGGYWAWDPVENASLMPWLAATAYLHSVMVEQREGMFKRWNFALMFLTFELCIFGTFLTRSGIVSSVHAFADSNMGPLFLTFIGTSAVLCLVLLLWRSKETRGEKTMVSLVSRESAFFLINLLFLALTLAVMWGTMYPAFASAANGEKVSVSQPFFNRTTWPLALAVLLLIAFGPWLKWRNVGLSSLGRTLALPGIVALVTAAVLLVAGIRHPIAVAFFAASAFVIVSLLIHIGRNARAEAQASETNLISGFARQVWTRKKHYGAVLAHLGVAVAFIGILGSSAFNQEYDLYLKKGQRVSFAGREAELVDFAEHREINKDVVYAQIRLYERGRLLGEVRPEKHFHFKFEQPQTEIAIASSLTRDLYVVLMGWEDDGSVTVRINDNPMIAFLWLGGLMILAGSVYALFKSSKPAAIARQVEVPAENPVEEMKV
ncbi:MAG: heme lyase CcmF/NrfE family subunit [Acidobacteria bacterium]|nr:MAG: heme lyase CcmF/NrfE family subunit [Acidobacteriota bacterium]